MLPGTDKGSRKRSDAAVRSGAVLQRTYCALKVVPTRLARVIADELSRSN